MPDHRLHSRPSRRARLATRPLVAALIALALLTVFGLGEGAALAAPSPSPTPTPTLRATTLPSPPITPGSRDLGDVVRAGHDFTLGVGQTANSVLVIGGDADIAGTVLNAVIVLGGDADIRSTAQIGSSMTSGDPSVVVVSGDLHTDAGATITGKTTVVSLTAPRLNVIGSAFRALARPHVSPVGWIFQLLFICMVTVTVVALFPRQVRPVSGRILARPLASLGWGALGVFMTGVVALILVMTIIGILAVIPMVLTAPFLYLFVSAIANYTIGELALSRVSKQPASQYLAAIAGAVIVALVDVVPVIGPPLVLALMAAGFGALLTEFVEWRRRRKAGLPPTLAGDTPEAAPADPTAG